MQSINFLTIFVSVVRHWKRKPLQLFLMILGLTTATTLWNTVYLINNVAKTSYSNATTISKILSNNMILSRSGKFIDDSHFGQLRQDGWAVTPRVQGKLDNIDNVIILGVDIISSNQQKLSSLLPENLKIRQFIGRSKVILAAPETAKKLKNRLFFERIVESNNLPEGFVVTDISVAQQILNLPGKLTSLELTSETVKEIGSLKNMDLYLKTSLSPNDIRNLTKSFHLNLTAFGFLSYIVGLFIVYSTINLAYEQRKGLLKNLRSIGISTRLISVLMLSEVVIFSLICGLLGFILSFFLASYLLPNVSLSIKDLFGSSISKTIPVSLKLLLISLGISILGGIFSSGSALLKILKLKPLDSAKSISWYERSQSTLKYQILASLFFLCVIIILFKYGDTLLSSFILLGMVLLMATVTLPLFLWLAIELICKCNFKKPLVNWFFADSKQQISNLSISLMALLIALSVNIGVGGMVASFKKTFIGWLDQRLVSELYVISPNAQTSERIISQLSDKVDAILPIVKVSNKIDGHPVEIYGFKVHKTYTDFWPLIASKIRAWEQLENKNGLLINEQLSRRLQLNPNDSLTFSTHYQGKQKIEIAGIYSDYGNPQGQIMMPLTIFEKYFPGIPQLRFAIRVDTKLIPEIKNELLGLLENEKSRITDQSQIKTLSARIFDKTFAITSALSILTLGIAGVALFTSISALSDNRKAQLAPIWSIGIQRNHLALLEALRALTLAILTFVFSVPIGLLVVFILTNYINVNAFDWKLPIFFFPEQWLKLFIITIIMTLLSVLLHSTKLARVSPSDLLRTSSYET